ARRRRREPHAHRGGSRARVVLGRGADLLPGGGARRTPAPGGVAPPRARARRHARPRVPGPRPAAGADGRTAPFHRAVVPTELSQHTPRRADRARATRTSGAVAEKPDVSGDATDDATAGVTGGVTWISRRPAPHAVKSRWAQPGPEDDAAARAPSARP